MEARNKDLPRKARHFILTDERKKNDFGETLYRIQAVGDSFHAKHGELGGWIHSEDAIKGKSAWVAKDGEVSSGSVISGKSLVTDEAKVLFGSKVRSNGVVDGNATIDGSFVFNEARVGDGAIIRNGAVVKDHAVVDGVSVVSHTVIGNHTHLTGGTIYSNKPPLSMPEGSREISGNRDYSFGEDIIAEMIAIERGKIPTNEEVERHYKLTKNTLISEEGTLLYQIKLTKPLKLTVDLGSDYVAKKTLPVGTLGGYVSSLDILGSDEKGENGAFVEEGVQCTYPVPEGTYINCGNITIHTANDLKASILLTENKEKRDAKDTLKKDVKNSAKKSARLKN